MPGTSGSRYRSSVPYVGSQTVTGSRTAPGKSPVVPAAPRRRAGRASRASFPFSSVRCPRSSTGNRPARCPRSARLVQPLYLPPTLTGMSTLQELAVSVGVDEPRDVAVIIEQLVDLHDDEIPPWLIAEVHDILNPMVRGLCRRCTRRDAGTIIR